MADWKELNLQERIGCYAYMVGCLANRLSLATGEEYEEIVAEARENALADVERERGREATAV